LLTLTQNSRRLALAFGLALGLAGSPAVAENILLQGGGGTYNIRTSTFQDYKFRDVIKQQRDFSCGSAALATMLTYHYEFPITESKVLEAMYEHGDQEKIQKQGFSMLDMKKFVRSQGMKAEGYKIPLDRLRQTGIPAIALLNLNGYLHFVLVRGVDDKRVMVADPTVGMKIYSRKQFEEMWNGIFFVVTDRAAVGKQYFNQAKYWGRTFKDHNNPSAFRDRALNGFTLKTMANPGYF
jgi:uncharacterized protein